ncbi:DNA internalization-related competence protein ComEC/Rec2 [Vibrio hippocampi]|uniref:DNA internalization-related competence protein ComEC/Rec2 n=1 Tax=Vibrio hippocampi TaxID=654686 RepID=UPI001F02E403|nr:DNA internalization-related competence protein ComEC/Rec2 [Vibrio hippocampi]
MAVTVFAVNGEKLPFWSRPTLILYTPQPVEFGAKVIAPVTLKKVFGRLNQAGFDKEKYYFSNRWVAQANIASNAHFMVITTGNWRAWLYQRLGTQFDTSDYRRFYNALIFGDRNGLSFEDWRELKQTGLSHLLAISGLHVGIIFAIVWGLYRALFALVCRYYFGRYRLKVEKYGPLANLGCSLLVTLGYCALAQFAIPTVRAFIMLAMLSLLQWHVVRVSALCLLAWCAALLVTMLPFSAASTSFWLSLFAVASLMFIARLGQARLTWLAVVKTHLFLSVAFVPMNLLLFQGIAPLMFIYNLIFVPWFSFCLMPAMVLAVLYSVVFEQASWVWELVDRLFIPIDYALSHTEGGWLSLPPYWAWMALVGLLALTLHKWLQFQYVLVLLLVFYLSRETAHQAKSTTVNFMDVGHGLAVVLQQGNRAVLYDTGAKFQQRSIANDVLTPSLRKMGVDYLDGVIISHSDNDHAGGVQDIVDTWAPSWVMRPDPKPTELPCKKGRQWHWRQFEFSVFWPPETVTRAYNPHSCVVLVTYRENDASNPVTFLLTGDIEKIAEILVFRETAKTPINVLSVPHHGSRTSSSTFLHNKLQADYAVASAQWQSRWNIPHPEVKQGYLERGTQWFETGESGQIRFHIQGESLQVSTLRQHYLTPWYRQMLRYGVE